MASSTVKRAKRSRGFSMVGLMVGVAIALIGSLVIFQVFAVSEGYKRTTTSGGDAQQNGAIALYSIERDARQAGFGLDELFSLPCPIAGFDQLGAIAFPITNFRPIVITQGAGSNPDTIAIAYSGGDALPFPTKLSDDYGGDAANIKVDNRYGFKEGDLVLLLDPTDPAKACSLMQVTGVPGTPGQTNNIIHNSGNYTNLAGQNVPARFNPPGGLGVTYPLGSPVLNLGSLPVGKTYSVANDSLMVNDTLNPGAQAFADGIVNLQAQYGRDTNGDGIIDIWDEDTAAAMVDWTRVLAVRIAVVARSGLREKDIVTNASSLTLWTNPAGSAPAPTHTLSADDKYFRFKVYETIVPLRSIIWRP